MKILPANIGTLFQVFDASNLRQRMLVSAALLISLHAAWDFFFYQPELRQYEQINRDIASNGDKLSQLTARLQTVSRESLQDNTQIETLQQQIDTLNAQIELASNELIAPQQMPDVLQALLSKNKNLRIIGMQTIPPTPANAVAPTHQPANDATDTQEQQPGENIPTVYAHRITLDFEGDYLSTLHYIQSVEQLGWRIFWESVHIDSTDYPRSQVSVSLYTLSLDEGWIGV